MSSSYFTHSSPLNSCTKLWLLITKNKSIHLANPINAAIIILTPILIFLLIQITHIIGNREASEFPEIRHPELIVGTPNVTSIFYSPVNHVLENIVKSIIVPELPQPHIESFYYAADMDAALVLKDAFVGIEFEDHFRNILELPSEVKVALRFPLHSRHMDDDLRWTKKIFKGWFDREDMYSNEGFLYMQMRLSEAIIKWQNASAQIPAVHMQAFPSASRTVYVDIIRPLVDILTYWSVLFVCPCMIICQMIVAEKQRYLRDIMQIMGLPNILNWLSWFIVTFIVLMIPAMVIVILMKCFLCQYSNALVMVLTMTIYILSLVSFIFVICSIFTNAFLAMMVLCTINFVNALPFIIFTDLGTATNVVACLGLNSAMSLILTQILGFELYSVGIQWNNIFRTVHPDEPLSYGNMLTVMLFTSIFCILLSLYLDQLRPGGYSAPKKWYFPFTRKFYCPLRESFVETNEEEEEEPSDYGNRNNHAFEEVINQKPVIIDIRHLTKTFGQRMAVRDFTLKFYENEITVLLGHNGAGKTSIFMMLVGLYSPTSGRVLINGHDMVVSPESARKNLCICSQTNIFFEELSALWHINFYSRLKGLSRWNAEQEAYNYLYKINLRSKAKVKVKNLSTDMRRKLSLCCALCAGTKIVLCDEPSAYLDPSACRDVWNLLRSEREGRCILINTYCVNVAAMLGDRIGIVSNGELIGYGTSDFLINYLGPGYQLVCVQLENCNVEEVTMFLQRKMREVRLERIVGNDIIYRLPAANVSKFSRLFRSLETRLDKLKLARFEVTAPTMDETFLKLGAHKINQLNVVDVEPSDLNEMMNKMQETSKAKRCCNEWHGMFLRKMLFTRHNLTPFLCIIILPLIVAALNLFLQLIDISTDITIPSFTDFKKYPGPYVVQDLKIIGQESELMDHSKAFLNKYDHFAMRAGATVLNIQNGIENYIINNLDLLQEGYKKTYVAGATFKQDSITAWYNPRLVHGKPVSLNLVYKAIGNELANVDIEILNKPRNCTKCTNRKEFDMNGTKYTTLVMVYLSIAMSIFIILPILERITQVKQQQHLSGISLFTYWMSHLIWDYLLFLLMALSLIISLFEYSPEMLYWLLISLLAFAFSALSFIYLLSFIFNDPYVGMSCIMFLNIVNVIVAISLFSRNERIPLPFHRILLILPYYAMYSASLSAMKYGEQLYICESFLPATGVNEQCKFESKRMFAWIEMIYMLITGIVYFSLVLLISNLRSLGYIIKYNNQLSCQSQANFNEDYDVWEERMRVDNVVNDDDRLKDCSLVCDRITKRFRDVVPVNCVSFKINPYECFGLLGLSGAGKTCTLDMIVGNKRISQGNIYLKGFSMKTEMRKCFSQMGYCPQHDIVVPYMTGREMLKFACLIRGVKKDYIPHIIEKLAESFVLTNYLDQLAAQCTSGTKKKLNIAIAVLSPCLICLDDPVRGVDICDKHQIATVLNQMCSNGKSLLITSHSVSDCEVLCSCLAIMVKGRICCIGSPQRLKARFNRGISIKIQIGTRQEMDEIISNSSRLPSYSKSPDNLSADTQYQRNSTVVDEESPNEKGIQVKIKRRRKEPKIEEATTSQRESILEETEQSIGRGILVSKRKTARRQTTVKDVSHTGSTIFNVYVNSNAEYNYFSAIADVEYKFKVDFPGSYVTEKYNYRGLVTITIPNKDLKWSDIFRYMEDNRFALQIKSYTISQTTLEDIFMDFVQNHDGTPI